MKFKFFNGQQPLMAIQQRDRLTCVEVHNIIDGTLSLWDTPQVKNNNLYSVGWVNALIVLALRIRQHLDTECCFR